MHHNKPRAIHLLRILRSAQQIGKHTALINTSWVDMTHEYDDVLAKLDVLVAREARSAECLHAEHGVEPQIFPDLSLQHPARARTSDRSIGMMVTDFYSKEFDCFVSLNGGAFRGTPILQMRDANWQEILDRVAGCRVLVTGRFHGLMAALRTHTPFIAYPGNTPKLEGMLASLHAAELVVSRFSDLHRAARSWKGRTLSYTRIFEQLDALPAWKFPF